MARARQIHRLQHMNDVYRRFKKMLAARRSARERTTGLTEMGARLMALGDARHIRAHSTVSYAALQTRSYT